MEIALIFNQNRPDTMGIYFLRAFQQLGFSVRHVSSSEACRLEALYDLYVRIDDDDYLHPLPPQAHPAIYYVSDVHLPQVFKKVTRYARQFDLLFCPMQPESERLRRLGFKVVWLNPGCDPELHRDQNLERIYDVAFVGTEGGDPRRFYLQLLRERFPSSFIGGASHERLSQIYSQTKIGFSFPVRRECFTMRNFEIMAAGALLVTPSLRDDSIERSQYRPGEHLVVFDEPNQLFEQIHYFLQHPEERRRIAEKGQALTLSSNTYRHRVETMLEATSRILGLPWDLS